MAYQFCLLKINGSGSEPGSGSEKKLDRIHNTGFIGQSTLKYSALIFKNVSSQNVNHSCFGCTFPKMFNFALNCLNFTIISVLNLFIQVSTFYFSMYLMFVKNVSVSTTLVDRKPRRMPLYFLYTGISLLQGVPSPFLAWSFTAKVQPPQFDPLHSHRDYWLHTVFSH